MDKFSENLYPTSKFSAPERWHAASAITDDPRTLFAPECVHLRSKNSRS